MAISKFRKVVRFASVLALFAVPSAFAEDSYDQLAKELCAVDKTTSTVKIAIIPFSYVDKRASDGGAIVSERLTTRIGKFKMFQVIERSLLENVLKEQNLQTSGLVDAETAKQIGKVLGVDAIINGTLLDVGGGMSEVNARLIKTETAEVMTTASVQVKKIWSDTPVNAPASAQAPAEEQPAEQKQAAPAPKKNLDNFVDFFILASKTSKIDLKFDNGKRTIKEDELALDLNGNGALNSTYGLNQLEFKELASEFSMPIGLRFVGYGKNWGFGWELSYSEASISKQTTTAIYNNATPVGFQFTGTDYMKMGVFTFLSGDLLFRFAKGPFQPYMGIGMGFTLNTLTSQYVRQSSGKLEAMGIGFVARFPIMGVRLKIGESTSIFGEYRVASYGMNFDRGYTDEKDNFTIKSNQILIGIDF